MLLWPPPTLNYNGERVDLLALIPPNKFDDFSLPNREQHIAGLTLRGDRIIMDGQRYPDCERDTQHKLSDDIQASCREQGHCISVKEWADKNQHRGTLRLRLRCRHAACRFQFQLNWDSKLEVWYISRRRCGTFVHTCHEVLAAENSQKRKLGETGSSQDRKKARIIQEALYGTTATTAAIPKPTSTGSQEASRLDALESARCLLDLSRTPSSPGPGGRDSPVSNGENQKPKSPSLASATPAAVTATTVLPGPRPLPASDLLALDRYLLGMNPRGISTTATAALPHLSVARLAASQQKLALLRQEALLGRTATTYPSPAALHAILQQQQLYRLPTAAAVPPPTTLFQTHPAANGDDPRFLILHPGRRHYSGNL